MPSLFKNFFTNYNHNKGNILLKLTKSKLKQLIMEELAQLNEKKTRYDLDDEEQTALKKIEATFLRLIKGKLRGTNRQAKESFLSRKIDEAIAKGWLPSTGYRALKKYDKWWVHLFDTLTQALTRDR
jgi:hypothetical protein